MKECLVKVTTYDTKKSYIFPGKNPQLWRAQISLFAVDPLTGNDRYQQGDNAAEVYLERRTLENAKLLPVAGNGTKPIDHSKPTTPEELILELLALLGVFPE